jgi:hypothetical protein
MSQPFSRIPEPETPRPFKRRLRPDGIQQAIQTAWRGVRRRGEELWRRSKRHPRTLGMIGGAVALTLVGAYTLSASGIGRSACRSALTSGASEAKAAKTPRFLLLMDSVARPVTEPRLEIHYDVCGLPSGTAYRGRVQVTAARSGKKKRPARPKPLVISFQDKSDGVATRRNRELEMGKIKPGAYTLELTVIDSRGRERKQVQKIQVKAP